MVQICKKHSQVRLTSLLVMNELFIRSHTFRSQLVKRPTFDTFLENIGLIGDHGHEKLPPPKDVAKLLLKKAIEVIKSWNDRFGPGYPLLSNAVTFMAENGVDFNQLKVLNPGEAARMRIEKKKREEEDRKKLAELVQQLDKLETDIKSNLVQINNCFKLIYPDSFHASRGDVSDATVSNGSKATVPNGSDNSEDKDEEFIPTITHSSSGVKVTVTDVMNVATDSDSEDILSNMRDLYKMLVKENLVELKNVMSQLAGISGVSEGELKRAIDMKGDILSTLSKLAELRITQHCQGRDDSDSSADDSSTDDEDFVQVEPKEGMETGIPVHERSLYGLEEETRETIRMIDPNRRSCRVMLPSGRLCPRMDSVKCPFHGKMIDRDDEGNPVNGADFEYEKKRLDSQIPVWQEPSFLRDLHAATGLDLTLTSTKRKRNRFPGLKDVKRDSDPKKRIAERIFSKEARLKVTTDLDSLHSLSMDKFQDNWSYALRR